MYTSYSDILGYSYGGNMFTNILSLALSVLILVSNYRIYEKMGEEGWKSFIPIYNNYILYNRVWNVKKFWQSLILCVGGLLLYVVGLALCFTESFGLIGFLLLLVSLVLLIWSLVICVKCTIHLARYFKKETMFCVGLLFFPYVFYPILAFSDAMPD